MIKDQYSSGFSLVELLVALVVGALMAHALINAQQFSLYLAANQTNAWEDLNLTQELMASQSLTDISKPTGTWLHFEGTPGFRWKTSRSTELHDLTLWTELATDVNGVIFKWSWPVPE